MTAIARLCALIERKTIPIDIQITHTKHEGWHVAAFERGRERIACVQNDDIEACADETLGKIYGHLYDSKRAYQRWILAHIGEAERFLNETPDENVIEKITWQAQIEYWNGELAKAEDEIVALMRRVFGEDSCETQEATP